MTRAYDAAGNVVSETRASGPQGGDATRSFSYNGRGFLQTVVDEKGRERDYGWDPEGRVTSATLLHEPTESNPDTLTYTRNQAGELTGYTAPRPNETDITWSATYDQLGRLATETDGLGNSTTYRYNRAGELRQTDDPRGFTIDRSYDGMGREIAVTSSDGSVDESFDYNRASQMTLASNPAGDLEMSYLPDGKLSSVSFGNRTTTLDYWGDRLVRRTDPGVTADFSYDANGRMAVVAENATPGNTDFTYTDAGRLATRSEPSGLDHTFDYDQAGRFRSESVTAGADEVARFTRTYNAASEVTTETREVDGSSDNGTWDYTYDNAGRLQSAQAPDGATTSYGYDLAGNRTSVAEDAGTTTTYNYNEAGRLTSSSDGATYDHDPAGNLISISGGQQGTWTYSYDALSRMTSAEGGTQSITYALDALGRTVARSSAGSTTNYFYQDLTEQPVQVSGPSGTTDIVWALGEPLVQKQGGATRFFGTTPHGDVAYLADDTGTIQGTRTYSPYGEVRSNTGEDSTLGYQSDLTDPDSELVDMGARQYHPGLGRFTSSDPLQGDPTTPLSMNSHLYGHADPINNMDPTGLVNAPIGPKGSKNVGKDDGGNLYIVNSPSDPNTLPGHGWESGPVPPPPAFVITAPRRVAALPALASVIPPTDSHFSLINFAIASITKIRQGVAYVKQAVGQIGQTTRFFRNIRGFGEVAQRAGRFAAYKAAGRFRLAPRDIPSRRGSLSGPPFGDLSRAADFGIQPYSRLRGQTKGTGLQSHHLIEKRFSRLFGERPSRMKSIALTPREHQALTNAWRQAIPYGHGTASATRQQVLNVARQIYSRHPAIRQSLGL